MNDFVVATEGATSDGRQIPGEWLEQMAANYDPKKYGARINCEHIHGIVPNGIFNALGDVTALQIGKNSDGKKTLIASIDPTDELKQLAKSRQKIYTSCEICPEFADTGEAYLTGLAVTDYPASLGTDILMFAAGLPKAQNPLNNRKQSPDNVLTEAVEQDISSFKQEDEKESIFARVKVLLLPEQKKTAHLSAEHSEIRQALELLAQDNADLRQTLHTHPDADAFSQQKEALEAMKNELVELRAALAKMPQHDYVQRPIATGLTDVSVDY